MRTLASLIAVLACLGLAGSAHAQTATGQITGTVTDTTGARHARRQGGRHQPADRSHP